MWITVLDSGLNHYELHQKLWGLFPQHQAADSDRPYCYKDTGSKVYVLSNSEPSIESKRGEINEQQYMFTLSASARRGTYRDENGKRVRLPAYSTHEELKDWLHRRLDGCATVDFVDIKPVSPRSVVKPCGRKMVFPQAEFKGLLTVTNKEKFSEIAAVGIGQGCAFGLGAILLLELINEAA